MVTILLTGGLGFIGSNICVQLLDAGYTVIVIDNLSNSDIFVIDNIHTLTGRDMIYYNKDIRDSVALAQIFSDNKIDIVIHLAALKAVGDSIKAPLDYYDNNVTGTLVLLRTMSKFGCKKIVFSSSAAIYGNQQSPISEDAIVGIGLENPYAKSKYMMEQVLSDLYISDNAWSIVILRYFNPIGAHVSGLLGDCLHSPTNVFPRILNAMYSGDKFVIYGNDYDTPDGTGVRDYIHITDLSDVHIMVLNKLDKEGVSIYNVGTDRGTSVLELLNMCKYVTGLHINYKIGDRRGGDVGCLYASCKKLYDEFGWRPQKTLEDMCRDGWRFKLGS